MWTKINNIVIGIIKRFAEIFHYKITQKQFNDMMQFIKFGIVGLSNTVISYLVYVVSLMLMQDFQIGANIDYLIAQFVGFVLSVLWSFYWNRKYVFKMDNKKNSWVLALIKTYISYAFTGIVLNSVLSYLWVQILEISKFVAPIINLLFSVPLNFVMNKFWAFRKGSARKGNKERNRSPDRR